MASPEPSIKTLIQDLLEQITTLLRQEVRLAQAETGQKAHQALSGMIVVVAGLLLVLLALIVLAEALVAALATTMAVWAASLIVGGGALLIGLIVLAVGRGMLRPRNLMPERSLHSLREDKDLVMEKAR